MLTNTAVKNAKSTDKTRRLWDARGLYLEVSPTGGKWWRLKYRIDSKEKRISLGTYPDVGLADAREERDAMRKLIAAGIDPIAQRKEAEQAKRVAATEAKKQAAREAETFAKVAQAWMRRQEVAPTTAKKNAWLLDTFLLPELGALPIADITARDLLDVLRKVEATGRLESAQRAKQKAGQVFRFAILEGMADNDPTTALRGALKTPKTRHHAAITDPGEVGALMRAIYGYTGEPVTLAALKLSALCFVRPGELRRAEWSEIDTGGRLWRIPAEKMKMKAAHLVPLAPQALDVLDELRPLTGAGRYVFPSLRSANRPMSENTVNAALRRLGFTSEEHTAHGFRSMAATRLNEAGWRGDAIERQLAHAESDAVRAAYTSAAEHLDERVRMMTWWADLLDRLRTRRDVVPMRRKA